MKTVNAILNQQHDTKTKTQLIELLSSLSKLITLEEYQKVSGVDPQTELNKLSKKDLLAIVDDFKENYKVDWEKNLSNASAEIIRGIFGLIEADENRFEVLNASNADFAAELGNIDFENLIGGPMQAVIKAQNSASLSTVSFIKEVGFDTSGADTKLRMVDFSYQKTVPDTSEGAAEGATKKEQVNITVPFVAILNIPSLRVETLDIDFNVKLNSTFTKDVSSELGIDASLGINYSVVKFKASVSYKRTSSTGIKVEKEYSMNVKVKATNDEMPAGLEKVLGLMSA
ncbi:MAG TPA: DUF2589 domain-containing protein [Campylobacterales bacterium]|nr:DUF2589 domain-containing protein [Campylobacterales bacterium]